MSSLNLRMKIQLIIVFTITVFSSHSQTVLKLWETPAVLDIPESVLFDDSIIYVSNINGKPTEKNEMGYLSKLSVDGEIINQKWIIGLNAPKGMAVFENLLYVTDIDRIAVIDRVDGKILNFIPIENAKFLNDATVNEKGLVAFSDLQDNTIYLVENNIVSILVKNEILQNVNGLWWGNDALYAGTINAVVKIDVNTGEIIKYIEGTGGIDGIEKVAGNSFIISDWSGKVQLISPQENPIVLFDTTKDKINAADIEYSTKNNILYVPTFYAKSVVAYKVQF
ncbi:MAG: hypothetical protein JEZ09_13835 [Salinivirgaceae bacterium]|nr:hypothetical protein [Salinivirgaceae bacterium]